MKFFGKVTHHLDPEEPFNHWVSFFYSQCFQLSKKPRKFFLKMLSSEYSESLYLWASLARLKLHKNEALGGKQDFD